MKKFAIIFFAAWLISSMSIYAQGETVKHTFIFRSQTAKKVSVAGSFNGWSAEADPMTFDQKDNWTLSIDLPANYYQYKFVVDGAWIPDPENSWKINDGGDSFNSIIKLGNPPTPKRRQSSIPFPKDKLPEPVLETQPELVQLYYAAWQMAWNKIQHGTAENGFEASYMDEGFNDLIFQWDTGFIASFGIYGRDVFPAMPSLDNFYKKQRMDGYIQRVYSEKDGKAVNEPTPGEPMVNPPLFAWIEWRYYQISGDSSRLKRVLPVLTKYFEWIEKNCRTEKSKGLFCNTPLGSGMDNIPRRNVGTAAYIDESAQQALAALCITKIASAAGNAKLEEIYSAKYAEIKSRINSLLWDYKTRFYYDMTEEGTLSPTMHIGSFWTLVSEVCPNDRLGQMISHLKNPAEFWRPHLVPALAASQPEYDGKGHYWLGGVWAPTNYMVVKGLMANGEPSLADSIAFNHLKNISDIYFNFKPAEEKAAFEERYADEYHTIWECYSPELTEPATRWDNTFYSRQDFAGWTGLGPIALLIENVLGFDIQGKDNLINWTIKRQDRHGIKNIRLGEQKVTLIFEMKDAAPKVHVSCEKPFRLNILYNGKKHLYTITKTGTEINI
ncbi:MAG: MGH1-like glycoside hydrolase domain-containing protein [Syntrophomonadaceae bacterium]